MCFCVGKVVSNILFIVRCCGVVSMKSVHITTKVVSLNPVNGEVYSIQQYVIKFVIGFLRVFRFPPPIKLTITIQLKYC
jgi:hypothetical protein